MIRFNILLLMSLLFCLAPLEAKIYINEIMADNDGVLADEDGDYSDWVELYNSSSSSTVDLEGYFFTDDANNTRKWTFPSVSIGPNDHLIVFLSGKDRKGEELHTNFSLQSGGEALILSEDDGELEDYLGPQPLFLNVSFGRESDGDNDFVLFGEPSPDASNDDTDVYAPGYPLVINEVMVSNVETYADEDGDYSDWIEIYNNGNDSFDLEGYFISDDNDDAFKWEFPAVSIPAGGHLMVFASGKDKSDNELHTGFSLSSDGENITLSTPLGIRMDRLPARAMKADESFGRVEDGNAEWQTFSESSPNDDNNDGIPIYPLLFSRPAGIYANDIELGIYCPKNAEIHYTLDSSDPKTNDDVFDDLIELSSREGDENVYSIIPSTAEFEEPLSEVYKINTVRAQAFIDGEAVTPIITRSFIVENDPDRFNLPILSMVSDPDNFFDDDIGIYVPGSNYDGESESSMNCFQSGEPWERPVHIEFFEDGDLSLAQDAGIRIHGGGSRREPQKAMRLYARSDYGPKYFDEQFFPQKDIKQFKRLVLRGKPMSNRSCMTDEIGAKLAREMNIEHMAVRQTLLFINGEFWGIYGIRERIDENYIEENFGHQEEDITILNGNPTNGGCCVVGTSVEYNQMITFMEENDLTDDAIYEQVEGMIDIDNLIDYLILQLWAANYDWPRNNIRYWKPEGGKWRWIIFDLDFCMRFWDRPSISNYLNIASSNTNDWSTFLGRELMENEDFEERFTDRLSMHLSNTLSPERVACYANQFRNDMAPHMQENTERFAYGFNAQQWQGYIDEIISEFCVERPCQLNDQVETELNISLDIPDCDPYESQEAYVFIDTTVYVCEGEAFEFENAIYDEDGEYLDTLDNATSCGTILLLDLEIQEPVEQDISASICEGESFEFAGEEYSTSGNYSENYSGINGCDSTVHLNLTVKAAFNEAIEASLCEGETFTLGSINLDEAGAYEFEFQSTEGCDSSYVIEVSISEENITEVDATICEGESYEFAGVEYDNPGLYFLQFESEGPCDSLVHLLIEEIAIPTENISASICSGSAFTVGEDDFDEAGNYTIVLTSVANCDSIVELELEVLDELVNELDVSICEGQSFELGDEELTESGNYLETFTSVNGCDSIVTLDLSVFENIEEFISEEICQGESIEVAGETYDETGSYELEINNGGDCSTTYFIDLEVFPIYEQAVENTICAGENVEIGGNTYSTSGNYTIELTSIEGCDSIIALSLQVHAVSEQNISEQICQGETYLFGEIELNLAGDYSLNFESTTGCDSIVNLSLDIAPNYEKDVQVDLCEGESYFFEGNAYDEEGIYDFDLIASNGCDSLVHLSLVFTDEIQVTNSVSICLGEVYQVGDNVYTSSGEYIDQFVATGGCDSVITTFLEVGLPVLVQEEIDLCDGSSIIIAGEEITEEGEYQFDFFTSLGCDSIYRVDITLLESPDNNFQFDPTDQTLYLIEAENDFAWFFEGEAINPENSSSFQLTEEGEYTVEITNDLGCVSIASYNYMGTALEDQTDATSAINIYPNPVLDNINFKGLHPQENYDVSIYSVNGQLVLLESITDQSSLNVQSLEAGIYIVEIHHEAGKQWQRIVKQ